LKAEFPLIHQVNLEDISVVKCTVRSSMFSIASGGRNSVTDHLEAEKHRNALLRNLSRHRKYTTLKLGGGEGRDRSSD
jgi:hypothetical protein